MDQPISDAKVLLDELTKDYERLRQQKIRHTGGVEARVLTNLAMVAGEQHVTAQKKAIVANSTNDNKLHLVFNLIGHRMRKCLGRLTSIGMVFKANPNKKDPKALAEAEVVDRLDKALDEKLDEQARMWERVWWMAVGGVCFEYTPWIPNAQSESIPKMMGNEPVFKNKITGEESPFSEVQQQVQTGADPGLFEAAEEVRTEGDVGAVVYGPLNVFVDASVRAIEDLAPDQRVYIANFRTHGWIQENFPDVDMSALGGGNDDLKIISTQFTQLGDSVANMFLADMIPLVQGSRADDDPPMDIVVESYAPRSFTNPNGRYDVFVPGKMVLREGVNDYGDIPITDIHWTPPTTTFWTQDYVTDLIAPQRFLNKRLSQLGEHANDTVYSPVLLGPNLAEADVPTDYPGYVKNGLNDQGVPMVQRAQPALLPQGFLESIELVVKLLSDIAGGSDLFQESKFPGQLRGPLAVPLLQEILDTEWGMLYEHLGQRVARIKQQRLNRVKQFYPPARTLHYTSRDMRDEVFTFHTEEVLRGGTNYNFTVERGSLMPELRALREARVRERLASPLAILYMDDRTGQLDKGKVAQDLQFGDVGRESKEARYRKLACELIERLWKGEYCPPVMPFWDHNCMMDELEAAMATTEWLSSPQQIQMLFIQRWQQHQFYLQQAAMAQQSFMANQAAQGAMQQAAQQTAATTAAATTDIVMDQLREGAKSAMGAPRMVGEALSKTGNQPPQKKAPNGPSR